MPACFSVYKDGAVEIDVVRSNERATMMITYQTNEGPDAVVTRPMTCQEMRNLANNILTAVATIVDG